MRRMRLPNKLCKMRYLPRVASSRRRSLFRVLMTVPYRDHVVTLHAMPFATITTSSGGARKKKEETRRDKFRRGAILRVERGVCSTGRHLSSRILTLTYRYLLFLRAQGINSICLLSRGNSRAGVSYPASYSAGSHFTHSVDGSCPTIGVAST